MRREVRMDIVYPHPPERIWKALTDHKALEKWLMPNDFQPRLGHRFRFLKETPDRRKREVVQCEVVELDAPRRLAYTWRSDPDEPAELVSWTLEPVAAGTRLRLEHTALEDAATPFTAQLDPQWSPQHLSQLANCARSVRHSRFVRGRVSLRASSYAIPIRFRPESEVTHV